MYKCVELIDANKVTDNEKQILRHYLNRFAPYAGDAYLETRNKEMYKDTNISNLTTSFTYSSYDRVAAKTQIRDHANSYDSPPYPNLADVGGDCANFGSQALSVGGFPQDSANGWNCSKKVTNPIYKPANNTELTNNWNIGGAWMRAAELHTYLSSRVYKTETLTAAQVVDSTTYSRLFSDLWSGDIVFAQKKTLWWWDTYHTMEVSGFISPDPTLASHTSDYLEDKLKDVVNRNSSNQFVFIYANNGY